MKHHDPQAGVGALLHRAAPLLALLVLAGLVAACVAPPASAPAPPAAGVTAPPAPTQAAVSTAPTNTPAPTTRPAQAATASIPAGGAAVAPTTDASKLPVGVDADGNFYRGDVKAPIRLQDFSDFQ